MTQEPVHAPGQKSCPSCGQPLDTGAICHACILRQAIAAVAADTPPTTPASTPGLAGARLSTFVPPTEFSDYQLRERLGEGAMGVVYRATKKSLRKDVAIKFIRTGPAASSRDRSLFLREAELASRLDHPHIVTVTEVSEQDGFPYLVMRYVDGRPLSDHLLEPGYLPSTRERVRLLVPVVRAVHHAHQRGIIHRDLKPGNILLDRDGVPYVSDFGLARWASHQSTVTFSKDGAYGTPAFMPPEQALGKSADLTTSGDVWSLGVILYALISGRLPFDADSMGGTVQRILKDEPPPLFGDHAASAKQSLQPPTDLKSLSESSRRDLESICLRCLVKESASRYPSAASLADDLDAWLAGKPVEARPPTSTERMLRWARRHPAASGAIIATLVAITAISWSLWQRQVNVRTEALGRLFNYVADMNLAQRALREGNPVLFKRSLDATQPEPGEDDLLGIEWGLFKALEETVWEPVWFDAGEPMLKVAVHPTNGLVAALGMHHAFLLSPSGSLLQKWPVVSDKPGCITFSPDGELIALGTTASLEFLNARSGQRTLVSTGNVSAVAFSPQGRSVAASFEKKRTNDVPEIRVFDRASLARQSQIPYAASTFRWSRSDTIRLANSRTRVWDWTPGGNEPQPIHEESYNSPVSLLSTSGRHLLRTSRYGMALVIDLANNSIHRSARTLSGESVCAAFSDDDRLLAITTDEASIQIIPMDSKSAEAAGVVASVFPGHNGALTDLAFADSNRSVVTVSRDGTIRRLPLTPRLRKPFVAVEHHMAGQAAGSPVFSADSRYVALVDTRIYSNNPTNGVSMLWDTQARQEVGRIPGEVLAWNERNQCLAWNRDGSLTMWDVSQPAQPRPAAVLPFATGRHKEIRPALADRDRLIVTISREGIAEALDVSVGRITHRLDPATLKDAPGPGDAAVDYLCTSPSTAFAGVGLNKRGAALWDVRGDRVIPLQTSLLAEICFSPDGSFLAVTDYEEHQLRLFDGRSGTLRRRLSGHLGPVTCFIFSPDGRQIVTGGNDSTLVVWNVATGREVFRHRLDAQIAWTAISPDASWLVTGHLPTTMGVSYGSLGLGHYGLWHLTPAGPESSNRRRPSHPNDSVWARFSELARASIQPVAGSAVAPPSH